MIYEWLWSLIRSTNECNEYPLYLFEVSLERVQEAARLQVLRCRTYGQPIVLDDIPQTVPICSGWTKSEQAQRRITAV
jgi:hypothetical protein